MIPVSGYHGLFPPEREKLGLASFTMPTVSITAPQIATKELALQRNAASSERWLRLSSNMLDLFGFSPGVRIDRRVLSPSGGFELRASTSGLVKVHQRTYHRRRNNPFETVIDLRAQDFINAAIPCTTDRIHYTFRPGVITGRPVHERTFHIRKAIRNPLNPLEAFIGLSSGVDAACLSRVGFGMQALLEYRPQEKRDSRDLTETGIVTAMANSAFRIVFNENIFTVDMDTVRNALKYQPPLALLALSPQCDDFTACKPKALKAAHLASLETTVDMVYECLRLIETTKPAVVLVENVPGFGTGPQGELLALKLRRWGYNVTANTYDARDFGGATSRKRFLLVASVFPGFVPPAPSGVAPQAGGIWSMIEDQLEFCSDATHTSSLQDGITTGRVRLIKPESAHAPTVLKSQSRHTKDGIYAQMPDGRYLFPNETILRRLQGIPDDFSLGGVSGEIAAEQIGQSIDWKMHHAFAEAIRDHLAVNRGEAPTVSADLSLSRPVAAGVTPPQGQAAFEF